MINIPYNAPLMAQITPSQNIPVQTSQNNFQTFQQPQTVTQQMQTNPCINPQDSYKQPSYQLHQADVFFANHHYIPNVLPQRNPYQPVLQPSNVPPVMQTQPNYGPLPPNILEQIRGCVSNAAPIFILPGGCHQSTNHHQQPSPVCPASQVGVAQPTGQSTSFNYPPSISCPPSFYPYPIPLPIYEPCIGQTRGKDRSQSCGCCRRRQGSAESSNYPLSCCCVVNEPEEHHCGPTNDDTICSKRNCPASISLQALASQFLSLPGIISCAATRLILRKVPGSNITSTMEDTMDKAQRSISVLTKEQLLAESRIAQQVNALINLHMTTTPPVNIIPLLTLLQLKVNVLKAQVETLINKKVMECQGYGFEVETSEPIDPAVLALKTNAELRQLLSALRQKECDERLNANFSPYHSQRVIAEARLNSVQAKIRQVEAEFENRRCVPMTVPTISSRVIQQFAEARCSFGYAQTKLFEPYTPQSILESPDPFGPGPRNPRRLYIQPHVPEPSAPQRKDQSNGTSGSQDTPSTSQDKGTGEGSTDDTRDRSVGRRCSTTDSCSCDRSSSEESVDGDKKKLRPRIDRTGHARISSEVRLKDASLMKLTANVVAVIDVEQVVEEDPDPATLNNEDAAGRGSLISRETSEENFKDEMTRLKKITGDSGRTKDAKQDLKRFTNDDSRREKEYGEDREPMAKDKFKSEGTDKGKLAIENSNKKSSIWKKLRFESKKVNTEPGNVKASNYVELPIKREELEENGGNKALKEQSEPKSIESIKTMETDVANERDYSLNKANMVENGEKMNVQIVSMVTNIKYVRHSGDFERWMIINECTDERMEDRCWRNSLDESLKDTKEENETDGNYTCLISEKIDALVLFDDRGCEPKAKVICLDEETHCNESNFPKNRRLNGVKDN
ncbi:uncharacterized protein LOC143344958 [Colletes latitarsis]|uniref:uncharacterized protein LOC143344958 n=1 Tax=Colletes latitarsis TaxID=2605962 RepID=UPI0040371204